MSGNDSSFSGRQPKAVQSALRVLEAVARAGAGVTAKDVAAVLDMPSATTYRLLNILAGEGYLVRLPDLSGFALGHKISVLIDAAVTPTVCTAAREVLADFRLTVRFGVHLAYFTTSALRIADNDPEYPMPHPESFLNRNLHAVALGKLLLAEKSDPIAALQPTGLTALTRSTIVSRSELEIHLQNVRDDGFAVQTGEIDDDTACLAVPIRSQSGSLVAGLVLSGSASNAVPLRRCLPSLLAHAQLLSPLLA